MPWPIEASLVALSLLATFTTGRKIWQGWILAATSCAAWMAYFLITGAWGPTALNLVNFVLCTRNGFMWYRSRPSQPVNTQKIAPEGADSGITDRNGGAGALGATPTTETDPPAQSAPKQHRAPARNRAR